MLLEGIIVDKQEVLVPTAGGHILVIQFPNLILSQVVPKDFYDMAQVGDRLTLTLKPQA